jgi:hypothetical protein
MHLRRALHPLLATLVLLATACSEEESATTTTSTSSVSATATSSTQGSGGAGGSGGGATSTSTGEGGGSGGQGGGGASDLAMRLVGDWKPLGMEDSGMGFKPAQPNEPFFVFGADNSLALGGCGTTAGATWSFIEGGAPGALGIVTVSFGQTMIKWYVIELDETKFTFGEGGDKFYFERSKCQ